MPSKTCVVCEREMRGGYKEKTNPEGYAREHGVPCWLLRHLNVVGVKTWETVVGTRLGGVGEELVLKTERDPPHLTIAYANVCGLCNTGWMKSLETAVEPILKPLVDGGRDVRTLSPEEREVLAKWTLKTAFFRHDGRSPTEYVTKEHIRHLWKNEALPPGVAVFGMSHNVQGSHACDAGKELDHRISSY